MKCYFYILTFTLNLDSIILKLLKEKITSYTCSFNVYSTCMHTGHRQTYIHLPRCIKNPTGIGLLGENYVKCSSECNNEKRWRNTGLNIWNTYLIPGFTTQFLQNLMDQKSLRYEDCSLRNWNNSLKTPQHPQLTHGIHCSTQKTILG